MRAPIETAGRAALKAWMAAQARSAGQVAEALGVSQPAVSQWVRGISRPAYHHRVAIQREFGIEADAWMTEEERATALVGPSPKSPDRTGEHLALTDETASAALARETGTEG